MVLIVLRGLSDRCLIKGLRREKNEGETPDKKSFRITDGLWQLGKY